MTNEEFIKSIQLEGEEWRDIVGYEGFYKVSSMGRIVALGTLVKSKNGSFRYREPKLKKTTLANTGYLEVRLSKEGKNRTCSVHRIVAIAFIQNPWQKATVDHIDRDRTNNNISNLRWCSLSENMRNPLTISHISKLSSQKKHTKQYKGVVRISIADGATKTYESLCSTSRGGFSPHCVYTVCSGRKKTHKGYKWMYLADYETKK